jgi:tetratricopeptide (TPR) repeat protein
MKSMTKLILALAAMLTAAGVSAQIKVVQSDFIEKKTPLELRMTHDNIVVAFDVKIDAKMVQTDKACLLTPQFVRDGKVVEALPPVVVEGRKYARLAREKKNFDKAIAIPFDTKNAYKTISYEGDDVALHYQYKVAWNPELKGATLVLNQKVYDICGLGTGKRDKKTGLRTGGTVPVSEKNIVLAEGVTDYSEFRRDNQVVYYYPNYVEQRYENNFSNESVFRIDRRTIDINAFVRYGYTDFKNEIDKLRADKDVRMHRIEINTSASPEGSLKHNKNLAEARANAIANYLVKNLDLPADMIEKQWVDENWDAFMHDLDRSDLNNKDEIRRIVNSYNNLDARENELRKLSNWNEIFTIFQNLRNCHIVVYYTDRERHVDEILIGGREMAMVEISGKPMIALEKTEELYNTDPKSIANINNMMVALTAAGRYKEAETYALQIPNRDITPVVANNKGVLYSILGERRMAETMFEMATDIPLSDYNMALMYLADEQYDKAADILDSYNVQNSAAANLDAERYAAAARNTHIDDVSAENYYIRAVAYAKSGEDKIALSTLGKAIELDPSYFERARNQSEFIGLDIDKYFASPVETVAVPATATKNNAKAVRTTVSGKAGKAEAKAAAKARKAETNAAARVRKAEAKTTANAAKATEKKTKKVATKKADVKRNTLKAKERTATDKAKAEAKIAADKAAKERAAIKAAKKAAAKTKK